MTGPTPPARRPPHRPSRLTPDRQQRIVDSISAGNTLRVAAEMSGIGNTTLDRYLQRGYEADSTLTEHLNQLTPTRRAVLDRWDDTKLHAYYDRHTPETERPYRGLWVAVTRARAAAEERAVALVREAGLGYEAVEEVTESREQIVDGQVQTLTTTKRIRRFVRDWRAEAWWLERSRREDWGVVKPGRGGVVVVEAQADSGSVSLGEALGLEGDELAIAVLLHRALPKGVEAGMPVIDVEARSNGSNGHHPNGQHD